MSFQPVHAGFCNALGSVIAQPVIVIGVVMATMLIETWVSRRHERRLRARGAVEPPGDVYAVMAVVYPGCFLVMAAEGALTGPPSALAHLAGGVVFVGAKALKWWAMASLGARWSFRVLVLPSLPLLRRGPYAFLRHPNYLAVVGELIGVALLLCAPVSGPLAVLAFAALLWRRIRVEERALSMGRG